MRYLPLPIAAVVSLLAGCGPAGPPATFGVNEAPSAGPILIRISSISIGPDLFADKNTADPSRKHLSVTLRLLNASGTKKVHFDGWGLGDHQAALTDDLGNHYANQLLGESGGSTTLYPGQATDEGLSFECPVPAAKTLTLWLPTDAFDDQGGIVRFAIPAAAVRR